MADELAPIVPPIFVEFDDGTLLSFPTVSDAEEGVARDLLDSIEAWDATGTPVAIVQVNGYRPNVSSIGSSGSERDLLSEMLRDHLRARNVTGVDRLSLEEMVYKASIRFVAIPVKALPLFVDIPGVIISSFLR